MYNEIPYERGNGILFDMQSSTFSIRQPGLYFITIRAACGTTNPVYSYILRFKQTNQPDAADLVQQSAFAGQYMTVSSLVFFSPTDSTFPITNLSVDWTHDVTTGQNYLNGNYVNKNFCSTKIAYLG